MDEGSQKTVYRDESADADARFAIVRGVAQNPNLSYEALGMLTFLLSQPDDYVIEADKLTREGCGRDKVYRILKELSEAGYIAHKRGEAHQHQPPRWGIRTIHESPISHNPAFQETVTPVPAVSPNPANQETVNPPNPDFTQLGISGNGETSNAHDTGIGAATDSLSFSANDQEQKDQSVKDKNTTAGTATAPAHEGNFSGKNPYALYAANIGELTPFMATTLQDAVKEYSADWVYDAIGEACEQNVRRWSYIEPILKRWKAEGKNTPRPATVKGLSNGNGAHKPARPPPVQQSQKPVLSPTSAGAPDLKGKSRAREN